MKNISEKPNEIIFSKTKKLKKENRINNKNEIKEKNEKNDNKYFNLNIDLNFTKEKSNEFFEISNENKEKEKKFIYFFRKFSNNFSKIKENLNLIKINNKENNNIESFSPSQSPSININFSEFKSFLNNIENKNNIK